MKKLNNILHGALLEYNLLTVTDFDSYLADAEFSNMSLKEYLIDKGILSEKQILIALSQHLNTEFINFSDLIIEKSVLEKVPTKFAWYYKILPVKLHDGALTIASANPLGVNIIDELRVHLGMEIQYVLGEERHLLEALKKNYGLASDTIDRILTKDPQQKFSTIDNGQWIEDLEIQTDDPTVSSLVNQIILEAYKKRATDIHIEPYRNKVRFRYRIDGTLVDANLPEKVKHFLPQILSRIKILANLSITEKRLPQDGSAVVKTKEQQLDLRVSTMPTPRGESIVIRILPSKVMLFSLERLGFNPNSVDQFRKLIQNPHGIIFITGPTGSGKTTTLYACLNEINSATRKIITIEDPVEYEMDSITQVQVNPKVKFNFATGLRSILRHDPDIIMVGEVRDPETAEIAIKTALTGHLVFSTLHTNDASSGITRLIDMGIEPYLVASSVEAFIAQRLIRVICNQCKVEDPHPLPGVREEVIRSLRLTDSDEIKFYKGVGCDHCNQTGYYGRIAIYEILTLNDSLRAAILDKPRSDYIKKIAMQEGLATLRQNGWQAVIDGITTPDEVINVTIKDECIDDALGSSQKKTKLSGDALSIIKEFRLSQAQKNIQPTPKNAPRERIYPRLSRTLPIIYKLIKRNPNHIQAIMESDDHIATVCENISSGGVQFITDEPIVVGSTLDIQIQLEGADQGMISCLARVCRLDEKVINDRAMYMIAAYYLDMSNEDRHYINAYVAQRIKDENALETR